MQTNPAGTRRHGREPASDGLPSAALVRAVQGTVVIGGVLALALMLWRPVLPNERARTGAAPHPTPINRAAPAAIPAPAPADAAAAPAPTASAAPRGTPTPTVTAAQRHTVQAGDTLRSLADRYDTTIDALRAANPGINPDSLPLGRELTIPASR